jgi:hypothetical protein
VDEFAAIRAWRSVVGAARLEPMDKVHNAIWRVIGEDRREWVLKQLPEFPPGVGPVEEYRVLCYLQAAGLPVAALRTIKWLTQRYDELSAIAAQ